MILWEWHDLNMPFRTTEDAEVEPRSESQFTPSVV